MPTTSTAFSKLCIALLCACAALIASGQNDRSAGSYRNPVIASDAPDPSVIRVGDEFWATTTTSEWGPPFLIWKSDDLVNWELVGSAFDRRPAWSESSYWASEFFHRNGKFYLYYTARKQGGPLCVAVATAPAGSGPYSDSGPLVCQELGSIDAFPVEDEKGKLYLLWKEDGNSRDLRTPIWAQPLSVDGTKLIGERVELLRNDASWERNLVEGPYVMRRDGWFYMFYSGNACCGRECDYALGVARAKNLLGPWEKHRANPILKGNRAWKCPGHGTVVTLKDGRDYLMYHAYSADDGVYVGRQALLDRVEWRKGWPVINGGNGPSTAAPAPLTAERGDKLAVVDEFSGERLAPGAQWPHAMEPGFTLQDGKLRLRATGDDEFAGALIARPMRSPDSRATTVVDIGNENAATAGLAAYGDPEHAIGIAVRGGQVQLWQRERTGTKILASTPLHNLRSLHLRLDMKDGHKLRFSHSADGQSWRPLGGELDGRGLPPWDRGVRVALTAGGSAGALATFDRMAIEPATNKPAPAVAE